MPVELVSLRKRREFVSTAASGYKWVRPSVIVQAKRTDNDIVGIGFTVTRKIGNAVVRNRTKRRLREAARVIANEYAELGVQYVLIGRSETLHTPFEELLDDIAHAFTNLNRKL
jgi:ribonuclease P protein component